MRLESSLRPLIALLLIFAVAGCDKAKPPEPQAEVKTPVNQISYDAKGQDAPAKPFLGPDGGPATLTKFRGKPLLVNLWATWCAPCIAEMPTLDALAGREKDRLQLIVVSQDLAGKREVDPFFQKAKFQNLQPYLDKENVLMEALKIDTLPTTIFYDAKGKEQWRVVGGMDWNGAQAKALIDGAITPAG